MNIEFIGKDENTQDATTNHWFKVNGETYALSCRNDEYQLLDCDGCPIAECNEPNDVKAHLVEMVECTPTVVEYEKAFVSKIIIDHPGVGLIYAEQRRQSECDQYCEWSRGVAIKAQPGDTLEFFATVINDDWATHAQHAIYGWDTERPLLEWSGKDLESMIHMALGTCED